MLELEMASPVSRGRVYAERLAALWLVVLALVVAVSVVLTLMSVTMDLGLEAVNLVAAGLGLWVFAGTLGTLAFAVGAATGRRSTALGVAAAVAALSYVLAYLGPLVDGGAWMERISPYHWYIGSEPLRLGFDWGGLGLLLGLAVLAVIAGMVPFTRREVTV